MKRLNWFVALAGLAIALPTLAQDKPAEPKKSRAEQLADIQADFRKIKPEIEKELQAAKNAEAVKSAFAKTDPVLERAYKLIAENPKDDVSLNALLFTMQTKPEPLVKSIDLLIEHHISNPLLA